MVSEVANFYLHDTSFEEFLQVTLMDTEDLPAVLMRFDDSTVNPTTDCVFRYPHPRRNPIQWTSNYALAQKRAGISNCNTPPAGSVFRYSKSRISFFRFTAI